MSQIKKQFVSDACLGCTWDWNIRRQFRGLRSRTLTDTAKVWTRRVQRHNEMILYKAQTFTEYFFYFDRLDRNLWSDLFTKIELTQKQNLSDSTDRPRWVIESLANLNKKRLLSLRLSLLPCYRSSIFLSRELCQYTLNCKFANVNVIGATRNVSLCVS